MKKQQIISLLEQKNLPADLIAYFKSNIDKFDDFQIWLLSESLEAKDEEALYKVLDKNKKKWLEIKARLEEAVKIAINWMYKMAEKLLRKAEESNAEGLLSRI